MFPKISPIIPVRRREIFDSREELYEIKHDGVRALGYLKDGRCPFVSRNGNEMKRFGDLSALIAQELKVKEAVLDGEIVAVDESGRPAFYDLMRRQRVAVYYAFDLLWLNGRDLRELPLVERKKILRSVIPRKSKCVGYVSYAEREAGNLFELMQKQDLEGLVVKRKDGQYKPRQTLWYKVLNPTYTQKVRRHEFFQRN